MRRTTSFIIMFLLSFPASSSARDRLEAGLWEVSGDGTSLAFTDCPGRPDALCGVVATLPAYLDNLPPEGRNRVCGAVIMVVTASQRASVKRAQYNGYYVIPGPDSEHPHRETATSGAVLPASIEITDASTANLIIIHPDGTHARYTLNRHPLAVADCH